MKHNASLSRPGLHHLSPGLLCEPSYGFLAFILPSHTAARGILRSDVITPFKTFHMAPHHLESKPNIFPCLQSPWSGPRCLASSSCPVSPSPHDLDSSLGSQASSYFHDFALAVSSAWNVLPMACFSLSFSFQHKRQLLREASWATQSLPISLACFNNLCNKFLISYVVCSLLIFLLDRKRHEIRGLRVPYSLLFSQSLWCCLTLVGGCYVLVKWMSELSGRTRPRT